MFVLLFYILIAALSIILCAWLIRLYEKKTNAIYKSIKRLNGKTVILTGGTAGMGLEAAQDLARRGARVIVACPFQQEGIDARKTIIENTGNENVIFKHLDLASLDSIRTFTENVLATEKRLDILINNAGVLFPGDFLTADGMNFVMQVNYFGHFLLTMLLLPLLKKTGTPADPSRIVNISSLLHIAGTINLEKMNKVGYWFQWRLYANSKLAVSMFTRELNKKLNGSNVVVNCVDPGAVGTRIYDNCGKFFGEFIRILFGTLFKTPWEGAQTALYLSLDDNAGKVSGEFFKNCKLSRAIWWAYNEKKCERLWEESVKLVQLEDFEL